MNIKDVNIKQFETDLKNKIELQHENQNIDNMYQKNLKDITSSMTNIQPYLKDSIQKGNTKHGMTKIH